MRKVYAVTDGACINNPGPGGYAGIYFIGDQKNVVRGCIPNSTNNKSELIAVIRVVERLPRYCEVTFEVDSSYVMLTKEKWAKWKNKPNLPNRTLWEKLTSLCNEKHVYPKFVHIDGHSGHELNEECDRMAKQEARALMQVLERRRP